MTISQKVSEHIASRIKAIIDGSVPDPSNVRGIVAKLNLLPLHLDMGGCYAIRPSGELVSFAWDYEDDLRVENDPRIRNLVLFQGSKKCPELAELIPPKTPESKVCSSCSGTGIEPTALKLGLEEHITCYCGGVGWLP